MPARSQRLGCRAARAVGDALLWVGAAAGVLCALLAVLGAVGGFGVVLFRTGSMSPSIPAGSAALVRTVDADQVEVGDVVTVDRPGRLPVTHRVVAVEQASTGDPQARSLTLRGDANSTDDPAPYTVTSVRRVIVSVPGVARTVAAAGDPRVLGPVAIGVSALITVVLWPRRHREPVGPPDAHGTTSEHEPRPQPVPSVGLESATAQAVGPSSPVTARRRAGRHVQQVAPVIALVALTLLGAPRAAHALPTGLSEDAGPGLVIASTLSTSSRFMAPGDVRDWLLTVSTYGLEQGEIVREVEIAGSANPALSVEVAVCGTAVGDLDCPSPVTVAGPVSPSAASTVLALPAQDALSTERLRVRVTLASDAGEQGLRSSLTFTAAGDGVAATVVPPGDEDEPEGAEETPSSEVLAVAEDTLAAGTTAGILAITGLSRTWPLLLVVAALLTTGTAHLVVRRTVHDRRRTR
jgi:signal peptidase I